MEEDKPLRERLQDDVLEETPWEALRLHAEKDAVLLLGDVTLIDAGEALALDDATKVAAWLQSGALRRPSDVEKATFEREKSTFEALIVQPWVLIKAS